MYSVYINHFNRNNATVDTEELMFSVPLTNNALINKPAVKSNEDAADTFSFSMEVNSPYYDALLPYKTEIRVEYDGDVIFWGRVLPVSTSSVLHTKNVQCEGTYAYFNDTYYEGVQEKHRTDMTVSDYLTKVINNHNNMVPAKQIFKGEVYVTLPTKQEKYEPTAWTQTTSILSDLTNNNGGHMRVRYTNGDAYLDWYKYYIRDLGDGLRPSVTVGKNIIDMSSSADNGGRFTRVIPIGATNAKGTTIYIDGCKYKDKDNIEHTYSGKAMPVSFIRNLYTSAQLTDEFHNWTDYRDAENNYGIIYKTMSFANADSQEKLFDEVKKWIKESYFSITSSFTVKAIDFHIIDGTVPKILLGDCVDVTFLIPVNGTKQWVTKKLVCKAVQYDLYNPENNSYTFGIPSDLLNVPNYKKSSKTASQSTANNNKKNREDPGSEDPAVDWYMISNMIYTHKENLDYGGTAAGDSFWANGELSGTVQCYDPNDFETGENPQQYMDRWFNATQVGKITLSGKTVKYVCVSSDRGIFAYSVVGPSYQSMAVAFWYSKYKGYILSGKSTGISTGETIALMIEKDTDTTWGGTAAANSFRENGKINGTLNKCFDAQRHTAQETLTNPSLIFTAEIAGKFVKSGTTRYVAVSKEHGVFGYTAGSAGSEDLIATAHWYSRASGLSYDNISNTFQTEDGQTYSTDDGKPEGNKTIQFSPRELSFPEYSATQTYTVGSMVTHGGYIWKCKTNISTPEAWNSAHWTQQGSASKGEVLVGYDVRSGVGDNWKIKLNTPVQYTDADGNVKVADGFVSASDFAVQEIPSFKTKIGIFDIVIAGKVEAQTISADLAEVRKWLGDNISVNTWIRTDKLYSNNVYSYKDIFLNSAGNNHYQYQLPNATYRYLDSCLYDVQIEESNGTITIILPRLNGSEAASDSFNMADTQFYKDALDSARSAVSIGSIIYTAQSGDSANTTLDPGQWSKAQGTFINQNGQTVTTTSYRLIKARDLRLRTPATSVTPGTSSKTIEPGSDSGGVPYDGLAKVVVVGDADLVAGNIKKDVVIFGVTGTYEGSGGEVSFVDEKCYKTTITAPQATDDDGNLHNCIKVKSLGNISADDKSIRVIFKVGGTQYNYYFGINGN